MIKHLYTKHFEILLQVRRSAIATPFRSGTIPFCGANDTRAADVMYDNAWFY